MHLACSISARMVEGNPSGFKAYRLLLPLRDEHHPTHVWGRRMCSEFQQRRMGNLSGWCGHLGSWPDELQTHKYHVVECSCEFLVQSGDSIWWWIYFQGYWAQLRKAWSFKAKGCISFRTVLNQETSLVPVLCCSVSRMDAARIHFTHWLPT